MINLSLLDKTIVFATRTHAEQVDKAGKPYILHILRVAMNIDRAKNFKPFRNYTSDMLDKVRIVCLLHDTIEDTRKSKSPVTINTLRKLGYPEVIIEGIDGMTRRKDELYKDFIQRAMQNPLSHMAKVCDLLDNMDLTRLSDCPKEVQEYGAKMVKQRYSPALDTLLAA